MAIVLAMDEDLKTGFREYLQDELERAPSTINAYLYRLNWLERTFDKPVERLTADDLRSLKRMSLAPETVKGFVVAAHQFSEWGALEGHWKRDEIALVRTPRINPSLPDPLSLEQVHALKTACRRPLEFRLIYVGLYTGTRIGESAALHGSMWEEGWLRFRGEKNQRMREVPVHRDLEEVKWQVLGHPPTDPDTLQRVKRRLARRVGFHFVAHQLRDTFSTRLYDAEVDDRIVKELIGHTTGVTGRYVEVSRRRKLDAINKLDYGEAT